ncbi:sensor histidine kinase [Thermodesulfobacteriota bacterium]
MKFRHSLRARIIVAYCLFGAVLGTLFAVAVYLSLDFIDDNLVNTRLSQEIDHLGTLYQNNIDLLVPASSNIEAYVGTALMPPHAKQMVSGIDEGVHEIYHQGNEYHVAVKAYPNRIEPLYLFYDVSSLEFTETRKLKIGIVLVTGVILVIGLGLWIGFLTSRKVIAPVTHLAEQVGQSGPENLPIDLSKSFYNDEVGLLSKTLEEAMQRVDTFVKREKKFSRDASHELRTPVTVIKGALEILQKQPQAEEKSIYRLLNRIERAVANMENIIETFLWLGREDSDINDGHACKVLPVIEDVIEQCRHLFAENPVEIDLIAESDPVLNVQSTPFQAVMANLIQNAVRHSPGDKITIQVCKDRITVSDTGEGIAACDLPSVTQPYVRGNSSKGTGLGLAIVKRLCERMGWHFEIESDVGKGTVAQLYFHSFREDGPSSP